MAETLALKYPDRRQFAEDDDFASLRADPEFRRLAGLPPKKALSRDEQWRYDLDFTEQERKRLHFSHYHSITPVQFAAEVRRFRAAIPSLNDQEIVVGFFNCANSVYNTDGNWHFTEASKKIGPAKPSNGLGIAFANYDRLERVDIFVDRTFEDSRIGIRRHRTQINGHSVRIQFRYHVRG
jgi:hypothetical protein